MRHRIIFLSLICIGLLRCNTEGKPSNPEETYPDIKVAGAMKNVMWKGELAGIISLDTLSSQADLYGLGPESYLKGELLIIDGQVYVSKVLTDTSMTVERTSAIEAPFFVYGKVREWSQTTMPDSVGDIQSLERYLDEQSKSAKRPFIFKLVGTVAGADIHIQNLAAGTKVSSPQEAHQGQINYQLEEKEVEIVGFFSTEHKGIFTHHDSFLHMHLITQDRQQMGHLDRVVFDSERLQLWLPIK